MGSNTQLTQKYLRVKVQIIYVRPHIYKQIFPILIIIIVVVVSLYEIEYFFHMHTVAEVRVQWCYVPTLLIKCLQYLHTAIRDGKLLGTESAMHLFDLKISRRD